MIDFILYETDEIVNSKIRTSIYKFFGAKEDEFKIYSYESYNDKSEKDKIYILSSLKFEKLITIAAEIRNNGDFTSPIIIISDISKKALNNDLLILSYIDRNKDINNKLTKSLEKAYDILINYETFNFVFNRIIYRIPLKDILYIEKENNSNRSIIHTSNNIYKTNCTIKEIEKCIRCIKFMKVHRSCIVNLDKVIKYDFCNNILYFKNTKTDLISREKRPILKEKLLDNEKSVN